MTEGDRRSVDDIPISVDELFLELNVVDHDVPAIVRRRHGGHEADQIDHDGLIPDGGARKARVPNAVRSRGAAAIRAKFTRANRLSKMT